MSNVELNLDQIVNKTISNLALAGLRIYSIKGIAYVDLPGAERLLGKSRQTIYRRLKADKNYPQKQSWEGRTLFSQLLHLMNRYCRGVIVEGVETPEEWRDVQNSPAFAAQGWFLSRPAPPCNSACAAAAASGSRWQGRRRATISSRRPMRPSGFRKP